MSDVPEIVKFRRYIDNDSGEYLCAKIIRGLDPEDYNEWEEKLLDAIGYETTVEFEWNTVTGEINAKVLI